MHPRKDSPSSGYPNWLSYTPCHASAEPDDEPSIYELFEFHVVFLEKGKMSKASFLLVPNIVEVKGAHELDDLGALGLDSPE